MFLNSKIIIVPFLILFIGILFSIISLEFEKREAIKEEKSMKAKIDDVRRSNDSLEKFIKYFDNPLFVEKEARLRLNYKASGEEVVFVHRDLNAEKASSAGNLSIENLSNYKKWWYWLLGH